jgi:hypothetical protein
MTHHGDPRERFVVIDRFGDGSSCPGWLNTSTTRDVNKRFHFMVLPIIDYHSGPQGF